KYSHRNLARRRTNWASSSSTAPPHGGFPLQNLPRLGLQEGQQVADHEVAVVLGQLAPGDGPAAVLLREFVNAGEILVPKLELEHHPGGRNGQAPGFILPQAAADPRL